MSENGSLRIAKFEALPENLDRILFIDAMMGSQFMIWHALRNGETFLVTDSDTQLKTLKSALPGIEFSGTEMELDFGGELLCLVAVEPGSTKGTFDGLYRLLSDTASDALVSFAPAGKEEVVRAKAQTEEMLSVKEISSTTSLSMRGDAASETSAKHMDIYYDSHEKEFLLQALESLNRAMLANGTAYKVVIFIPAGHQRVYNYLRSKLLILEERRIRVKGIGDLYRKASRLEGMLFDSSHASRMLGFSNRVRASKSISTSSESAGDVCFGSYLEGSAGETQRMVGTSASSFNLGTLISGVPGTGKTLAAMHLLKQLAVDGGAQLAVVSPTEEWDGFGYENGMSVIRLYAERIPINFFKCDGQINAERFFENLAMLIASASDAGPYTGSLEKCALAAFRKVYARDAIPDPIEVYEELEEAIVEQHAKRSNVGVRYTKHGENVRASLENLRSMLNRPEFSKREGINFADLLQKGVVFDLSLVSNKMKPFFYALILNQVYSIADSLDSRGDGGLRLLLCVEEAQLIFAKDRDSAATRDLEQRIQDFRKKGVGLMLVTHNVSDIEPEIRRLCQTKLYFRQSSDVAKQAANDLLFSEEEKEAVTERLKGLEQRICALNYIKEEDGGKHQAGSLFVKLPEFPLEEPQIIIAGKPQSEALEKAKMGIKLVNEQGIAIRNSRAQVFYVGERVWEGRSDNEGLVEVGNTISGNAYRLVLLGERKKDNKTFRVRGGELNIVKI